MDNLHDAFYEMKRIDHLIFVSLKYTRTVDVLISVLKRFISSMDYIMNTLFLKAIEDDKIESIPDSPVAKAKGLLKIYDDEIIQINLNNYVLFRRLTRADYTKRNEYRRYVTMTVDDNGTIVEIDIDNITEYYDELKDFFSYVKKMVE